MDNKTEISIIDILRPKCTVVLSNPISYEPKYIIDNFELDFDVKLKKGINLQREFCWSDFQKEELIITMLKDIVKLPPLHILIEDTISTDKKHVKVIDGKQRLSTILDYIEGKFPITVEDKRYFFDNLDKKARMRILGYNLTFKTYFQYDDNILSDEDLIDWFEMVNFTQTPQDKNHLENLKK